LDHKKLETPAIAAIDPSINRFARSEKWRLSGNGFSKIGDLVLSSWDFTPIMDFPKRALRPSLNLGRSGAKLYSENQVQECYGVAPYELTGYRRNLHPPRVFLRNGWDLGDLPYNLADIPVV
jgi:hypothetical protein